MVSFFFKPKVGLRGLALVPGKRFSTTKRRSKAHSHAPPPALVLLQCRAPPPMEGHRVHVVHLLRPDLLIALSEAAKKQSASGEFSAVASSRALAELAAASEWCAGRQAR